VKYYQGENTMKIMILTLCFFIFFLNFSNAGELYNCTDRDGNSIVTDSPQDGMKNCVLKDSYVNQSQEEPANEKEKEEDAPVKKDNAFAKAKSAAEAREKRINNCFNCCRDKSSACYNYTANGSLCLAENQNCAATCNSEGSSPSSWSDCWSASE
jgi:hypothetical protein